MAYRLDSGSKVTAKTFVFFGFIFYNPCAWKLAKFNEGAKLKSSESIDVKSVYLHLILNHFISKIIIFSLFWRQI